MELAYYIYPLPKGTMYTEDDLIYRYKVAELFGYCQILEAVILKQGWQWLIEYYGYHELFQIDVVESEWHSCKTLDEYKNILDFEMEMVKGRKLQPEKNEMMKIEYRAANSDDLDEICDMVSDAVDVMIKNNIFQWDDLYPTRDDFREDIDKNQLYVGMVENCIAVIYALNQEYDTEYENGEWKYKDEPFYIIHRLCVNPAFQNKGIAKSTLHHIEEELKSLGIHAVRLDVFSKNQFALKLYTNQGYLKTGFVNWRKGEFYLMEKHF